MILTYKSINAELQAPLRHLLATGRLHSLALPWGGQQRYVIVSEALCAEPGEDEERAARLGHLQGAFDDFMAGGQVMVGESPFGKDSAATLARIDPSSAEVWDFRVYDNRDGIRCFGRFAGKDAFVALSWEFRECIPDLGSWDEERNWCVNCWRDLFGVYGPFIGGKLDDYLSEPFDPV